MVIGPLVSGVFALPLKPFKKQVKKHAVLRTANIPIAKESKDDGSTASVVPLAISQVLKCDMCDINSLDWVFNTFQKLSVHMHSKQKV